MKLVAVLAASLLSVGAFAQSATVETSSAGLLGKRYAEAGFGLSDYRHTYIDGLASGLNVNLPVNANFDASLGYSYAWFEGDEGIGHSVNAAVTGYLSRGGNKPYARLGLGYAWLHDWIDSDHGVWSTEVGIERAVNDKVSATFSVGYADDFGQHRAGLWDVSVGGTYAFCSKLVGTAEISYIEYGTVGYAVGLAYRF